MTSSRISEVIGDSAAAIDSATYAIEFSIRNINASAIHQTLVKNKEVAIDNDLGRVIESLTVTNRGVERPIGISSYPNLLSFSSVTSAEIWGELHSLTLRGTFWSDDLITAPHQIYALYGLRVQESHDVATKYYFWNRQD